MRQLIAGACSKTGIFSPKGRLCEYFVKRTSFCSIKQERCLHDGLREDCEMLKGYEDKLQSARPKTFEERYGENWRRGVKK